MKRRTCLSAFAGLSASAPLLSWSAAASAWSALPATPRMPVLFLGHGSPMNALGDNAYSRAWAQLGAEFGRRYPKPNLILCISAHWLTDGFWLTAMSRPRTIHDFGGFPQALFDQQYPAPGAPALAKVLRDGILTPELQLDPDRWGFDHGTWSVLKPMFPRADIPVIQLSMDYGRPAAEHFALGRRLSALRERGVLIVGSGNVVHNLRATRRDAPATQAYDWAREFDAWVQGHLQRGELEALVDFQGQGELARLAHPTYEHYLPLLYAAGAAKRSEMPRVFNADFQSASISMRSVVWG